MTNNMKKEKSFFYTIMNKTAGILPCWNGQRMKGSQRSFVHDVFINACAKFNIYVDKRILYSEVPIHPKVNTKIQMVRNITIIQDTGLLFQNIVVRNFSGDLEMFLRGQKDGVFIYLATVVATDGSNQEYHCFVWNVKYYDEFRGKYYLAIIYN